MILSKHVRNEVYVYKGEEAFY